MILTYCSIVKGPGLNQAFSNSHFRAHGFLSLDDYYYNQKVNKRFLIHSRLHFV